MLFSLLHVKSKVSRQEFPNNAPNSRRHLHEWSSYPIRPIRQSVTASAIISDQEMLPGGFTHASRSYLRDGNLRQSVCWHW